VSAAEPELADSRVPAVRVRLAHVAPVRRGGTHVLYWMTAARRPDRNFALERALEWSAQLARPLLVLEPLRVAYPWASARLHRFVLDGMRHQRAFFAERGVRHHAYVEPAPGAGKGLLAALARDACVVVTDEYPSFFLPRMRAAAARQVEVRFEVVDSLGLVPVRAPGKAFDTAFAFRRWLQANLGEHLDAVPQADPLAGYGGGLAPLPREVRERWPAASEALLAGEPAALAALPIDASVAPVPSEGGAPAARAELARFLDAKLARYGTDRNQPDAEATSGLSPWLHFGHLSAHEVFAAVAQRTGFRRARFPLRKDGRRGAYGLDDAAEEFLDQLVTWRELGHVFAFHRPDHEQYSSLPGWARDTLAASADARAPSLALDVLERAESDDPVWNAAQRELVTTGRMHNYLRMLWGKKLVEWSPTPEEALARMVHLNNKYALDGRDPNSYSGIFWCLGRFDRPWGPKRPRFGSVRYMSSASTRRKLELARYLECFGGTPKPDAQLFDSE
jgi:deoxyribodipyrimidine photo-lyase